MHINNRDTQSSRALSTIIRMDSRTKHHAMKLESSRLKSIFFNNKWIDRESSNPSILLDSHFRLRSTSNATKFLSSIVLTYILPFAKPRTKAPNFLYIYFQHTNIRVSFYCSRFTPRLINRLYIRILRRGASESAHQHDFRFSIFSSP